MPGERTVISLINIKSPFGNYKMHVTSEFYAKENSTASILPHKLHISSIGFLILFIAQQ